MNELMKLKLDTLDSVMKKQTEDMERSLAEIKEGTAKEVKGLKDETNESIKTLRESTERNLTEIRNNNDRKITELNENNEKRLKELGDRTDKRLEEIKGVVEEKLTDTLNKRINESFKNVSDQLEQVYKGLGEMKSLAGDVGGLKQVLSGVKTRGILGEYQLGAILSEILSPEQYETDVATVPGSSNRVEFAIKLPGNDGECIYLPVDSKFPGDSYRQLQDAYDSADRNAIEAAKKALITVMKLEAKDIKEKYVAVPYTTNFGIMFLPFEGLYSEAVNLGMVETLQKEYQVNIVGPSTMGAMLSSLQMGFRTLAIQKRSDEVWKVLADVKTEFGKFSEQLVRMQKHLDLTSKDLDALMTTRTKALTRKLSSVQTLEQQEINVLPGIEFVSDEIGADSADDEE
ncbi:MAG: DNA recombination protein RmuC [Lachnospiraceae bacterium]|nr:DNA recombination protein RmuC [Lachnospiraceae bacterium]